jgi:hypothetical protein
MTHSQNTIIKYIRRRGKRCGVLIAKRSDTDPVYSIGWSLCNSKDTWNPSLGLRIAEGRAETAVELTDIPHSISHNLGYFTERCERYFKGCTAKNV